MGLTLHYRLTAPDGCSARRADKLALAAGGKPATAADRAKRFFRAKAPDILEILQTRVTLSRARPGEAKGAFVR